MYTIKLTGIIPGAGLKTSIYDLKSGKHSFKRLCEDHKQFLILTKHLTLTVLVVFLVFFFFLTGPASVLILFYSLTHCNTRWKIQGGIKTGQMVYKPPFPAHLKSMPNPGYTRAPFQAQCSSAALIPTIGHASYP